MKAKRDAENSWEKQTIWKLDNGWEATEEWNQHYGPFIKRLDSPDGKVWLACNGKKEDGLGAEHYNLICGTVKYIDLPEFAKEWVDKYGLVRSNFEKNF